MGEKRRIEVNIGGYTYKLMGEESEEHMQQVAMYIDEKIRQVQKMTSAQSLGKDYVAVLASINVADDFLKLLEHVQVQQERLEELVQKNKELEDKLDEYQDELMSLEQENLNYRELVEELQLENLRLKEQAPMGEKRLPELLAPAGDMECLKAAVDAGCDAVYLGGSRFNARQSAGNFSTRELEAAVRYCSLRGIKTYLTLNTLIKEREWEELSDFAVEIAGMGFSGMILQDLGVAAYLKRRFPALELHASTQMSVHNLAGVEFLHTLGFRRAVLAREMTLEEIRYVRERTDMELEVFVHGALCYSYSGRCLMSSLIGGRSGNRGRCAQPCRLPYSYLDAHKRLAAGTAYRLNLKDLCALDLVGDLVQSGVHSLKIEGRLKGPAYVAGVTQLYRRALDAYGRGDTHWRPTAEEKERLLQLYNRGGFSSGYFRGKRNMVDLGNPKHSGVLVGTVADVHRREMCRISSQKSLSPGDVIEIRTSAPPYPSYQLSSASISSGECRVPYRPGIVPGQPVFRLTDAKLTADILTGLHPRRLPITMKAVLRVDSPMRLTVTRGETSVTAVGDKTVSAQRQPLTEADVQRCLKKSGDTAFWIQRLEVDMEPGLFAAVSAINRLRREALGALENRLLSSGPVAAETLAKPISVQPSRGRGRRALEIELSSAEQLRAIPAECAGQIRKVLPRMDCFSANEAAGITAWGRKNGIEVCPVLPAVSRDANRERVLALLEAWAAAGVQGMEAWHVGQIRWIAQRGLPFHLHASFGIMNRWHAGFWQEQGAASFVVSPELTLHELRELGQLAGASVQVYGHLPVMVTEQCPTRDARGHHCEPVTGTAMAYLRDRKAAVLPVERCCPLCYNTIYSSAPVWLGDKPELLQRLPAEGLRLFFLEESPAMVRQIILAYAQALEGGTGGSGPPMYIRGHFFKGVE